MQIAFEPVAGADRGDLQQVVKNYDVRGLVGDTLTEPLITALGAATADELKLAGEELVIGHDMRDSSPTYARAFAAGARARAANIVHIGLCSTDMNYYASGARGAAAAMFTASHNPSTYNGIKISRAGARGISFDTGLAAIRDRAAEYLDGGIPAATTAGTETEIDVLAAYAAYLRELVDLSAIRPLKIVVDAGNGMGGLTVPAVLGDASDLPKLPLEIVPMYFELDGTFPNHEANPLDPKNLVDLQRRVVEEGADLGLAFDGDADRCFVVDEQGEPVSPSAVSAIVATREIARASAEGEDDIHVIHNLLTSRYVEETIEAAGATPVRTRVGHSLIKAEMARTGAVFGGEHSAHYYFRDFWGADNGMLAAMHVLATVGSNGEPVSAIAARNTPYFSSGEINSTVEDVPAAYERLVTALGPGGVGADMDELDGITFSSGGRDWWWANIRPSNTEPLLRLNVEAVSEELMVRVRDRALELIRA
ncbi:phosphomannomutase/phosphoglucomutase [Gulosibacter molinativorax]|uniref:Phosphomannomutase/phosphoglucomutase n=1 Tax=Gulosibacter molinativorax TaxID=256821 RepID=A0ABT7C964_9MICO|nr:phosphomannomutase/phosphoglucomutase [Gulosibacter molinativorax]MDJ1371309.1 phosphomannomutase/phosphoglucomutase [Gulosibacter molinativorax]QUY63627.1 Phosphoglucosamine mutase [Gulosibacter molinativorax]